MDYVDRYGLPEVTRRCQNISSQADKNFSDDDLIEHSPPIPIRPRGRSLILPSTHSPRKLPSSHSLPAFSIDAESPDEIHRSVDELFDPIRRQLMVYNDLTYYRYKVLPITPF